ncbi:MAG: hypothetical protein IKV19_00555 [Bacteroidaceae bacterium]|nr:hypothetical protein [Bacteroidaceae bacterium]
MKKIVFCLAMMVAMFVVSCSTPAEKSIKEYEAIVVTVESGSIDTELEYEAFVRDVDLWNEKYADIEYTPEQQNEIDGLNMRLTSALTEQFVGLMGGAFSGLMQGLVGGMNGLVDGMKYFVDGMQDFVDGVEGVFEDSIDYE